MPRNGSGTSSVINTFVIDTIADPDEVNANFSDVADQLTNSLPRDGQAGMNAPLPLQNGTVALPSLTFSSDTNTGIYRKAADVGALVAGGVEIANWSASGFTVGSAIVRPQAWELIGSPITLSGQSSVSWTNLDAYRHLRISLGYIPSPGSGNVLLRVSTDNGSSFISTSTYSFASLVQTGVTVTGTATTATTAMIVCSTSVDSGSGFLSTVDISNFNKNAGSSYKVISEYASGNPRIDFIYGGHAGTTARNALQILVASGNFTSGMVTLEGLRG